MEATSERRDLRSRKPEVSELNSVTPGWELCLPYDLLLAAVEHHDEDQTHHVIADQGLFPPEDRIEQILLQNLLRGRESVGGQTRGDALSLVRRSLAGRG